MHDVPYLKLNRELCNIAQEWAEKIANTGKFEHSNNKFEGQSLGWFYFKLQTVFLKNTWFLAVIKAKISL